MRQIKFRAWDTETKEMSYDFLNKNWLKVCIESPYVELMQWTGLTDRNGKEIYEGDIVKVTNDTDEVNEFNSDTGIGAIEWFNGYGFWNITKIENSLGALIKVGYVEVIGSIFENPELINS